MRMKLHNRFLGLITVAHLIHCAYLVNLYCSGRNWCTKINSNHHILYNNRRITNSTYISSWFHRLLELLTFPVQHTSLFLPWKFIQKVNTVLESFSLGIRTDTINKSNESLIILFGAIWDFTIKVNPVRKCGYLIVN